MEELHRSGRSDVVYAKVKKLTRKSRKAVSSTAIKDRDGKLLKEPDKIRKRWKEYIEILYDKEGKPEAEEMIVEREISVHEDNKGPELLTSEIVEAIRDMKRNKVVGVDDIPAEFLKVLGEEGTRELVEMCKEMYEVGVWPEDFASVVMIPLQKRRNAEDCED